ncbi:MAG: tetratricopeptide repeat protein, partial [bacterium]
KVAVPVFLILLASYSFAAVRRNFDWGDEIGFWIKTAEKLPLSARARSNLGMAYYKVNDYSRAKSAFEDALKVEPNYPPAHSGLGLMHFRMGDAEKAIKAFQKAGVIE